MMKSPGRNHRPRALVVLDLPADRIKSDRSKSNHVSYVLSLPAKQDLEQLKVEGKSPCGMVTVTLTGQQMPVSCDISEEALAEGAKALGEKVRVCAALASGDLLSVAV